MCRSCNETFYSNKSETKWKEEISPIFLSDSEDSDDEDEIVATLNSSCSKKNSLDSSSNEISPISSIENKLEKTTNATFSNSNSNMINLSKDNIEIKKTF